MDNGVHSTSYCFTSWCLLLLLEGNLNEVQHAGPLTEDNYLLLGDSRGREWCRAAGGPPQHPGKAHV